MQQVKGDALQRLASIALILGGILTLAANAAFPRADDPDSLLSSVMNFADNEVLSQITLLGITIGIWGIVIGVAGIYRSIESGAAAAWTRVGFYAVVIGGVVVAATLRRRNRCDGVCAPLRRGERGPGVRFRRPRGVGERVGRRHRLLGGPQGLVASYPALSE